MSATSNSMVARGMWTMQEALHGKNAAALPVALLGVSSVILVYTHVSESTFGVSDDSLKTFLALILIQMLPLVLLEVKILACADPIGLLCKFGSHVILMHAAFLALRVGGAILPVTEGESYGPFSANAVFLFLALVTLAKGCNFRLSKRSMLQHSDVVGLSCLALVVAYAQALASASIGNNQWYKRHIVANAINTGSDYIEILSFVPAVWMVYREDRNVPRVTVESPETKRLAVAFFSFLVLLYSTEDIYGAYNAMTVAPLAAVGHVVHFLLLLDFSSFILAHMFNPEKLLFIKEMFTDGFFNGI